MWSPGMFSVKLIPHLLICLVTSTLIYAEMCTELTGGQTDPPPVSTTGWHGQSITLHAESNKLPETYYYVRWIKIILSPETQVPFDRSIVLNDSNGKSWKDEYLKLRMSALYNEEDNKMSFSLTIMKLSCYDAGIYKCTFVHFSGNCDIRFNLSIIADPLPPVIKNDTTIRVDAGTNVTIQCEANVGKPAGNILWYYVPSSDRQPTERIVNGVSYDRTSAGDCREYMYSYLTVEVNSEDQGAKYRCATMKASGQPTHDQVEVRVAINGALAQEHCEGISCIEHCLRDEHSFGVCVDGRCECDRRPHIIMN